MNAETEGSRSPLDTPLLVLAVALLVGCIGAFYYFEAQPAWIRWLGLLAGAAVAVAIASRSALGQTALGYVRGSEIELRRVVWPTRKETMQTTLLIMVVVMVLAVLLWGFDAALLWSVRALTGREG